MCLRCSWQDMWPRNVRFGTARARFTQLFSYYGEHDKTKMHSESGILSRSRLTVQEKKGREICLVSTLIVSNQVYFSPEIFAG